MQFNSQTITHKPTVQLTEQQIEEYHHNGFLSIPAISTPKEIEMMTVAYDRIFSEQAGREYGDQFDLAGDDTEGKTANLPQILGPEKYAPELWDTLARANALQIVRQLAGADMEARGSHAIFKPARHGSVTPWHQDEAYLNPMMQHREVSVWMPLQDVDEENGCMQFIVGSHLHEVVPHQPIGNNPKVHGLELAPEANIDLSNPTICPLPAGGATFHRMRTLHFTAANHSNRPRRALIMVFGAEVKTREELGLPERHFEWQERQNTAREARAKAAAK